MPPGCQTTLLNVTGPAGESAQLLCSVPYRKWPTRRAAASGDCALFSRDRVNIWPLMDFDRFLRPQARRP
jgi:hypothetical protein